jgi:hypothetical protein
MTGCYRRLSNIKTVAAFFIDQNSLHTPRKAWISTKSPKKKRLSRRPFFSCWCFQNLVMVKYYIRQGILIPFTDVYFSFMVGQWSIQDRSIIGGWHPSLYTVYVGVVGIQLAFRNNERVGSSSSYSKFLDHENQIETSGTILLFKINSFCVCFRYGWNLKTIPNVKVWFRFEREHHILLAAVLIFYQAFLF